MYDSWTSMASKSATNGSSISASVATAPLASVGFRPCGMQLVSNPYIRRHMPIGPLDVQPLLNGRDVSPTQQGLQLCPQVDDQRLVDVRPKGRILHPRVHSRKDHRHGTVSTALSSFRNR